MWSFTYIFPCGRVLLWKLTCTALHNTTLHSGKFMENSGSGGSRQSRRSGVLLSQPFSSQPPWPKILLHILHQAAATHTHTLMLFYVFLILSLSSTSSFPNVFPLSRHTGPWEKVGQQLPTKRRQQISTLNQIGASFENFPDQSNEVEAVMAFGNTQKKHQKKIFLMSLDRRRLQRSYLWKAEHRSIMTKTFELQPFKKKLFCDFHVSLKPFSCSSFSLIRYLHASRSDHLASSLLSISTFTYS